MAAPTTLCAHHPDRPAHALCMACRKLVCQECATEWEGINYCSSCLARRRRAGSAQRRLPGLLVLAAVSGLLLVAMARLVVWTGVLVAGLR